MRVLVACEFSGIVREAFRAKGHDAEIEFKEIMATAYKKTKFNGQEVWQDFEE